MSPQRSKEQTIEALVNLIQAVARGRRGVMLFEDVHWADPSTIELLDQLISRVVAVPLLLVLTSRSPEPGDSDEQTVQDFRSRWSRHVQHFEARTIEGLTPDERGELVSQLTRGKALPSKVLEYIVDTTEGVPLFVEELTKTILESGDLKDDGARYTHAGDPAKTQIPATLSDSLVARLDRVAPARGIAQIGAAIGREFSYELLVAVASMSKEALDSGLARRTGLALVGTLPAGTERDRMELQLRQLLGRAVMDLQGWAAGEVSGLLEPALDLARSLDHQESFLPVLHGLWVHFMSAGRHSVAMSWAKKMAAVAAASERKNVKRDLQIVACRAKMTSLFWMGDLTAAAREAARIENEYREAAHGHIVQKTNTDPLTAEGIYRSQILWMLGFPHQALVKSDAKAR